MCSNACVCTYTSTLHNWHSSKEQITCVHDALLWFDANEGLSCSAFLTVPLYTEAIPCFDNVSFRFCRPVFGFMYVSYSSF